jgi:hypothetical protein
VRWLERGRCGFSMFAFCVRLGRRGVMTGVDLGILERFWWRRSGVCVEMSEACCEGHGLPGYYIEILQFGGGASGEGVFD